MLAPARPRVAMQPAAERRRWRPAAASKPARWRFDESRDLGRDSYRLCGAALPTRRLRW